MIRHRQQNPAACREPTRSRARRVDGLSCRLSQLAGATKMLVDVRTYTLIPRKLTKYVEIFEKHALPVMKRHGLELMGYYVSYIGALNQVVHLWRYDNLADMESKRTARDADPAWGEFLALTEGMILLQEDKVMRPASFSPVR
jgi:choline kinase